MKNQSITTRYPLLGGEPTIDSSVANKLGDKYEDKQHPATSPEEQPVVPHRCISRRLRKPLDGGASLLKAVDSSSCPALCVN